MNFLNGAEDVCFRDKYSYDLFSTIPQVRYTTDPVSYTHLDVYKRQTISRKRTIRGEKRW